MPRDRIYLLWLLPLFVFVMIAFSVAGAEPPSQVTLTWDAVSAPDLAGYRIFKRTYTGDYDYSAPAWEGIETQTTLQIDGHRAFVARAYDQDGNESADSNECSTWDGPPDQPGGLSCQ
jgi:hypothetical protein